MKISRNILVLAGVLTASDPAWALVPDDEAERTARPVKELKAFAKVALAPGESRTVAAVIRPRELEHWDAARAAFAVEPGRVEILVGTSSADICGRAMVPCE